MVDLTRDLREGDYRNIAQGIVRDYIHKYIGRLDHPQFLSLNNCDESVHSKLADLVMDEIKKRDMVIEPAVIGGYDDEDVFVVDVQERVTSYLRGS